MKTWKIRGQQLDLAQPVLMGVLNITPDSFSDGGRYLSPEQAYRQACAMVENGADILDLGAESTRPGAEAVSSTEELERLHPVVERICRSLDVPVSIDTTKPEVARVCLEKGAHIINDVSGLRDSGREMTEVAAEFGAGVVLMHRRGTPQTMQEMTGYGQVTDDVVDELQESLRLAFEWGIDPEQVVVDPGIGFAKSADQSLELIRKIDAFRKLGRPVMLGASRKSFIGQVTGRGVHERDYSTAAVCVYALLKGVSVLRVHHISAMRDVVKIIKAIGGEHVRAFQMGVD